MWYVCVHVCGGVSNYGHVSCEWMCMYMHTCLSIGVNVYTCAHTLAPYGNSGLHLQWLMVWNVGSSVSEAFSL